VPARRALPDGNGICTIGRIHEVSRTQDALRPRSPNNDPLWMLKSLTEREWGVLRCIGFGPDERFGVVHHH
jgi:hypothetical protein